MCKSYKILYLCIKFVFWHLEGPEPAPVLQRNYYILNLKNEIAIIYR